MLTKEELNLFMEYCPEFGELVWTNCPGNPNIEGQIAGRVVKNNYRQIMIRGTLYYAHTLVWLDHTGDFLKGQIDHIDGDISNNRIENLRVATKSQNMQNRKIGRNSTTGVKGVNRKGNKFYARVGAAGHRHASYHDTLEEADAWCRELRTQLHGEFTCHG